MKQRWYLQPLGASLEALSQIERLSVIRQAQIGVWQTIILAVMVAQSAFVGVLRLLPPDVRASVAFLHRIEWGVYVGIVLIVLQIATGWQTRIVLTNRVYLLAWPFGKPRVLQGRSALIAQAAYAILVIALVAAALHVRANGFIFQPTAPPASR